MIWPVIVGAQTLVIGWLVWRLVTIRRSMVMRRKRDLHASALKAPRLPRLHERAMARYPLQHKATNVLPPPDFSISEQLARIVERPEGPKPEGRRSFRRQKLNLEHAFAGQPELLVTLGLAISYLRRFTPHEAHARTIFFRVMDEALDEVMPLLNTRWLISALLTFADHGRTEAERTNGLIGYILGATVIGYESERTYWRKLPELVGRVGDRRWRHFDIEGAWPIDFGENAHLSDLAAYCYRHAIKDDLTGRLLERLLETLRDGDTVFSRADRIRLALGVALTGPQAGMAWSFNERPD